MESDAKEYWSVQSILGGHKTKVHKLSENIMQKRRRQKIISTELNCIPYILETRTLTVYIVYSVLVVCCVGSVTRVGWYKKKQTRNTYVDLKDFFFIIFVL